MLIFQIGLKFGLNPKATLRIIYNYDLIVLDCFCVCCQKRSKERPVLYHMSCFLTILLKDSGRTSEATMLACDARTQTCFANFDPHGEFRRSVSKMAQGWHCAGVSASLLLCVNHPATHTHTHTHTCNQTDGAELCGSSAKCSHCPALEGLRQCGWGLK